MWLPGTCYLLWPIFTFVSTINHLTVQSWGLSVAECRINSPLMHKKKARCRHCSAADKREHEPHVARAVTCWEYKYRTPHYIKVLTDKILPSYQTSIVNSRGADKHTDNDVESEWIQRREESTDKRINNEKRIFEGRSPSRSRPPSGVKLEVPVTQTTLKQAIPIDRRAQMRIREMIGNVRRTSASTLPGAAALSVLCSIISSNSRDARKCVSTFWTQHFISDG